MKESSAKICAHCGEPSDRGEFCCLGCRTAYHLIRGAGLEVVYRQQDRKWKKPQSSLESAFEIFENLEFLNRRAPLENGIRKIDLHIIGLMCSSCIWIVERLSHFVPEVIESRVDYGASRLSLKFKDSPRVLVNAAEVLSKLGYQLDPSELDLSEARIPRREWIRLGISGLSAAGAMHIGLVLIGAHGTDIDAENARLVGFFAGLAAFPALSFGAMPFFRSAWQGLKLKSLSSDLLVSMAVIFGALASFYNAAIGKIESYFDALSMVVFLLLAGRILVRLSMLKVISKPLWWARRGGLRLPSEALKVGDVIEIEVNDVLSVDSVMESNSGWFDLSHVSGESAPVQIVQGQKLLQGSVARSKALLRVEKLVRESYIEALSMSLSRGSWQTVSPRYETYFTVLILALAAFVLILGGEGAATKALALLIVTCPCALQLALPLGVTALKKEAFKRQILIFNPLRVLNWPKIKEVHFDKTGTLTMGSPRLSGTERISEAELTDEELYSITTKLALHSSHPLSKSLVFEFASKSNPDSQIDSLREIPGEGVFGKYEGRDVSLRRSSELGGMQTSLFCEDLEILRFRFLDGTRSEAKEVLGELHDQGFSLKLLSGDHQAECARFTSESALPFNKVIGGLSPEAKAEMENSSCAFIGDGLNDAKAMRKAGTSLGFSGSAEANLQAADAYLLSRDLRLLLSLRSIAQKTSWRIKFNLFISFAYNVLTIGLVMSGHLGPIICAIFMPLSSLTVMLIAFRPLRLKAYAS